MSYAPPQFLAACPISFLESGRQSQLQQFSRVYVNEEGNQKQKNADVSSSHRLTGNMGRGLLVIYGGRF